MIQDDSGGKQCHLGKRRNQRFVFVASCTWEVRRTEPDVLGRSSATFGVWSGEGRCNILGTSHVSVCCNVRAKLERGDVQLMLGFGSHLGIGIGRNLSLRRFQ